MNDKLELLQNKARQKGFDINPPEETIEEKIDASMEEFSKQIASAQAIIKFIDFKKSSSNSKKVHRIRKKFIEIKKSSSVLKKSPSNPKKVHRI